MSFKIYNGYRIKTNSELSITEFVSTTLEQIKLLSEELFTRKVLKEAVIVYDRLITYPFFDEKPGDKKFTLEQHAAFVKAHYQLIYLDKNRDPDNDFNFSLSIYSSEKFPDYKYIIVDTEQRELLDLFESISTGIKNYSYWNNTDRPDNISDEKWEERENVWKIVLENCEFAQELFNEYYVKEELKFDQSKIKYDHLPLKEDRAYYVAKEIAFMKLIKKIDTENLESDLRWQEITKIIFSQECIDLTEEIKNTILENNLIVVPSEENFHIFINNLDA